ncbi:hypothetical protein GLOTRDRAFT_94666 [Gloeophyllum trabeum ATCC 11539]|uniref:Uncharacterized protein n=1 Tax=Gloeophyllum trabeum (strain ATCC 11539 / FP-39264 / Madison 617) TaxID=670483 RepID=S7RGQ7_GLOTA|nr:uncharacterized protein GLOTRDRAFT_94666 [Gloeophyllum trabeum ATCC 11539]EPQ53400.1 hypothetical protein GLOTRDRAFT_94666 [Gloeophyllum trabeum ATCC 11539]
MDMAIKNKQFTPAHCKRRWISGLGNGGAMVRENNKGNEYKDCMMEKVDLSAIAGPQDFKIIRGQGFVSGADATADGYRSKTEVQAENVIAFERTTAAKEAVHEYRTPRRQRRAWDSAPKKIMRRPRGKQGGCVDGRAQRQDTERGGDSRTAPDVHLRGQQQPRWMMVRGLLQTQLADGEVQGDVQKTGAVRLGNSIGSGMMGLVGGWVVATKCIRDLMYRLTLPATWEGFAPAADSHLGYQRWVRGEGREDSASGTLYAIEVRRELGADEVNDGSGWGQEMGGQDVGAYEEGKWEPDGEEQDEGAYEGAGRAWQGQDIEENSGVPSAAYTGKG